LLFYCLTGANLQNYSQTTKLMGIIQWFLSLPGRSATQGDAFFASKASQAPSGQEKGKNGGRP